MSDMKLEDIKNAISKETGVPVELLDGETEEENRSRALALMAFRKKFVEEGSDPIKIPRRKKNSELFSEWLFEGNKKDYF